MIKAKFQKIVRYIIMGMPLAGAGFASLLPISAWAHQFLVLIILVWFQVFLLCEGFFSGK
jgi:hypothetical protein